MMTKHLCPVCGEHEFDSFGSYDICPVCDWSDDPLQAMDPDEECGDNNGISLNQYKKEYEASKKNNR